MSNNPYFSPDVSTDSVYRGQDTTRCLSDDLDTIEEGIESLETEKAPVDHIHTGYAAVDHTHNYAAPTHSHAQTDITGLADALATKANVSDVAGKADLVDGKVPESQLPSYVDDVVEYANLAAFPTTGESGKVYVALDTNKTYRWSGSSYVEISASLALGETSATAYRGDRGKTAYDHSQNGDVHVTAAQKTAWDGKAAGDHTHTPAGIGAATAGHTHTAGALLEMAAALFFTNASGGVEYFYGENSGKNLLTEMAAWPQGFHSAYSNGSNAGNPKDTESWRIFCHKTSGTIGWVLAFGTSGSIFSNYYDSGWKGWRAIYDALHAPLWTGEMYMTETHTIIPTKTLSNCAHGWLLLWSDYNPGTGVGNTDFATTMIPNFAYTGQKWNGGQFLCTVPRFADSTGEATIVKTLQVFDNKLVGNANNTISPRNDVGLRAVYEF